MGTSQTTQTVVDVGSIGSHLFDVQSPKWVATTITGISRCSRMRFVSSGQPAGTLLAPAVALQSAVVLLRHICYVPRYIELG